MYGKIILSNTCHIFSPLSLLHCYGQVATILSFNPVKSVTNILMICLFWTATKKLLLKISRQNYKEEHCPTQKEIFSWNLVLYPISQFLHKNTRNDLNYHFATNQRALKPDVTFKCKNSCPEFPGFFALRQHTNTQQSFPISTANIDPEKILNENKNANCDEESRSCQHFLVKSELERLRQSFQLCYTEPQSKDCARKAWSFPRQLEVCSESESGFWIHFKKNKR